MPFAFPGQPMPNHPGRKAQKLRSSWGYAPAPFIGPALVAYDGSPMRAFTGDTMTTARLS